MSQALGERGGLAGMLGVVVTIADRFRRVRRERLLNIVTGRQILLADSVAVLLAVSTFVLTEVVYAGFTIYMLCS